MLRSMQQIIQDKVKAAWQDFNIKQTTRQSIGAAMRSCKARYIRADMGAIYSLANNRHTSNNLRQSV